MDRLLDLFAEILEAPGNDLLSRVRECARCAEAVGVPADGLREFEKLVERTSSEKLAELYRSGSPLIGHQLYGEGYGRSMLLMDLQKRYRRHGFEIGDEPADHLCVLLRFLSQCSDPAEREEIAREVLVPGLESMTAGGEGEEPAVPADFSPVLRTVSSALKEQVGS